VLKQDIGKDENHMVTNINEDDVDFDSYLDDMKEKSERDNDWLGGAAFLLGSTFVLESLKPKGPVERPFLSKPQQIKDISMESFRDILRLDVKAESYSYVYSEKELNVFKHLMNDLKQHGRLEDSRSIENTALRWMEQKNGLLADFFSNETSKVGSLDIFSLASEQGLIVLIPWSVTGDNPCDECLSLDGELFDPNDFPDPPHFGCQCNDPMADPVIVFD
jgi:hypothetical protein